MLRVPQIRQSVFAPRDASKVSLGVLDLGGASMQITFVPEATGDLQAGRADPSKIERRTASLEAVKPDLTHPSPEHPRKF